MGLKCLQSQTQTLTEFHSFPSAPLSDAKEPGVLVSRVPYICSQERKQSLNKDRSTVEDKMLFL